MRQGHYIPMNTVMLSFVMLNKVIFIAYYMKVFPPAWPFFINLESWPVVGFCPHVGSTEVFEINLSTLYPSFGSLKEVFSTTTQVIGL